MSTVYFSEQELRQILCHGDANPELGIHLPNEIFDELIESIDLTKPHRGSEHIAYAYSYVYLITYLYRYAIYGKNVNFLFTEKNLKLLLQTPHESRYKNYITTYRNGILMQLNYIKKYQDIPFHVYALDGDYENYQPEFYYESDLKADSGEGEYEPLYPRNYKVNYPYRAFYHQEQKGKEEGYDGYFFHVDNTHKIPIDVFIFCMSRADLGTLGFYLYSFLKRKTDQNPEGWQCKRDNLVSFTGIKQTTLLSMLKTLESYNMIYNSHEPFVTNFYLGKKNGSADQKVNIQANTYYAKPFQKFVTEKQEVKVREVLKYQDIIGEDDQTG